MQSQTSTFSKSNAWPPSSSNEDSPVQLPLDTIPQDFEAAVAKLKQRDRDDLERARKHHRRALKALREGAYDTLPEETRDQLSKQLLTNLTALNEALDESNVSDEASQTEDSYSVLRKALTWLW